MASDLELIEQLENEIGEKINEIGYHEIMQYAKNGYAFNKNYEVIGLNLSLIKLVSSPSLLSKFLNLERLNLKTTRITDISFLEGLKNLISLDLGDNQITNISFLKGLINLNELYLVDNQIT